MQLPTAFANNQVTPSQIGIISTKNIIIFSDIEIKNYDSNIIAKVGNMQ